MKLVSPVGSNTVTLSATSTSSNSAITTGGAIALWITNPAISSTAFVKAGASAQTATTADFPIPPLSSGLMAIDPTVTNVAVILDTGSATISVTPVLLVNP